MRKKIVFLPYDFDTAIGINNEGALVFGYNLEDIDTVEGGADVYNGQQSVLWKNLRTAYFDELKAMYQKLRSEGALSYDKVEKMFEEHQGKWSEAIFNEDAWYKYLQPLVEDGSAAYLSMLQGSKAEQRKWWLYNRFRYIDSKYNAGDALSDVITVRGYAKADITVTPYADVYTTIKYGSYLVQERSSRGTATLMECPLDNVNDTEIYIYSASQLASVGDLSGLMVGYAEFSKATKLQALKIGDNSPSYSNGNLTELYLGNNVLLRSLDVRNCPNLTQAVDISGCGNIENVYFDGTSITGLTLPNGGILKVLHVPATMTNLTIRNQTAISEFVIPSYQNISTLRLENVSQAIDSKTILQAIPNGSRVRIIGFDWQAENSDEAFELLDKLDQMRGLDEGGNNVSGAQVSGTIHVHSITGAEYAEVLERYPNITVDYEEITSILYYYNYDGTSLLKQETIVNCGDGTYRSKPSRTSTAQYSYTFIGWSLNQDSQSADANALKSVSADRKVYAAYSRAVREYTVYFYNGTTLLMSVPNVKYGSSVTYTGETPLSPDGDPADYPFEGWNPEPKNIVGDTRCYARFGSPVLVKELSDTWASIIAATEDGTYKDKFQLGNYKPLELDGIGTVNMQIAAFDTDELADGSGNAKITFVARNFLPSGMRPGYAAKDWKDTAIHSYLSDTAFPAIPTNVRSAIKTVVKTHDINTGRDEDKKAYIFELGQSEDKLWIPSRSEVLTASTRYPLFKQDSERCKSGDDSSDYNNIWWLRDCCRQISYDGLAFVCVSRSGTAWANDGNLIRGVVLSFCI